MYETKYEGQNLGVYGKDFLAVTRTTEGVTGLMVSYACVEKWLDKLEDDDKQAAKEELNNSRQEYFLERLKDKRWYVMLA